MFRLRLGISISSCSQEHLQRSDHRATLLRNTKRPIERKRILNSRRSHSWTQEKTHEASGERVAKEMKRVSESKSNDGRSVEWEKCGKRGKEADRSVGSPLSTHGALGRSLGFRLSRSQAHRLTSALSRTLSDPATP